MSINLTTNAVHRLTRFLVHQVTSTRDGHGVHSPFVYNLCENVFYNRHPHYDFDRLNKFREEILKNNQVIETGNFGAGSFYTSGNNRKVGDIASMGISSKKQSEILYRLCN